MSWNFLGAIAAFFGAGIAGAAEQNNYNRAKAQIDAKHGKGSNLVLEYRLANKYYKELKEQERKARNSFTEIRHPEIRYYVGDREITAEEYERLVKLLDNRRYDKSLKQSDAHLDGEYIVAKHDLDGKPLCLEVNRRVWEAYAHFSNLFINLGLSPKCTEYFNMAEYTGEVPVSKLENIPWTECVNPHPNNVVYPCEISHSLREKALKGECSVEEACRFSVPLSVIAEKSLKLSRPIYQEAVAKARIETRRRGYMPDNDFPYGDFGCFPKPTGVNDPYVEKHLMGTDEIKNHGKIIDYDAEEV